MKNYTTDKLRNVALISHGGAGKTTLAETMIYISGGSNRLGEVDKGTSILDYDPEEIRRQISINSSVAPIEWKEHKINILDTPGYFDFVGDVRSSLRVADGAVLLVEAASGVEVGTEKAWEYADEYEVPRVIYVSKMDRENADFYRVLDNLREFYGSKVAPVTLPIGKSESFTGVVNLVTQKAYSYDEKGRSQEIPIPTDMEGTVAEYRDALIDAVAAGDDDLMMKYLEGEALTQEEIERGLGLGTRKGEVVPVFCGAAGKVIGTDLLLDYCLHCLPSPIDAVKTKAEDVKAGQTIEVEPSTSAPLCALVYKTMADPYVGKLTLFRVYSGVLKSDSHVYNATRGEEERVGQLFLIKGKEQIPVSEVVAGDLAAVAKLSVTTTGDTLSSKDRPLKMKPIQFPAPTISLAVEPRSKGDEEKIGSGLSRLEEEDPTFKVEKNTETGQTVISGMGELHLEVITSRLQKKFGVEVDLTTPKVPYRETIRKKVEVEGKHKKQSGGRGQFGHVFVRFEPLPPGGGFEFVDEIFGGAVPRQYIPAVEKGLRESMNEGVLAGYPVVDIKATLYDGSYHSVDSSEMAFKIAASLAFKKGMADANPVLLEPIMNVEITVPEAYMGDIMGDLNKKRGRILGMEPGHGKQTIKAQVPLAEMFRYAIDLRSMTQGRGFFTMSFDHYEEVPANIAEKVIAESKKETA